MTDFFIDGGRSHVNTWECDENDHLNVRFYLSRVADAMGFVAHDLAIGEGRSLEPVRQHVRFLKELRPGDVASMRSRPIDLLDDGVVLQHILSSREGVAAKILSVDRLVDRANGAAAPWTDAQRARLTPLLSALSSEDAPRSVPLDGALPSLDLRQAQALGLIEIFRGRVGPAQCDGAGRMGPEHVMSCFTDGVATLWEHLGFARPALLDQGRGSIALETRIAFHAAAPRAGALLVARSGLIEVMEKTVRFAHFLFDYRTGACLGSAEVVAALLDHAARRVVVFDADARARFAARLTRLPTGPGAAPGAERSSAGRGGVLP